jgi:hypothetical protein
MVFKRPSGRKDVKSKSGKDVASLYKTVRPQQLLALERRQTQIRTFLGLLSFSPERYEQIADPLLVSVASFLGEIPETRNSYFCNRGGFLDHSLSRTEAALTLARDYFVDENGEKAEELSQDQKRWMYALFSAALLRGIGKLITDFIIECYDQDGSHLGRYQPLNKSLLSFKGCYDYEFSEPEPDLFVKRSTIFLAHKLMPEKGLLWIGERKAVFAVWLALLDEDERGAGSLGHLLDTADAMAILKFFNERALSQYGERRGIQSTTFVSPEERTVLKEGELSQTGVEFIKWLAQKLAAGTIMINKAPLLMVPGGMLMNADIFKLFVRECPMFKNWLNVQKGVMQLGIHQVAVDGSNTQRFMDCKTNTLHSGLVITAIGVLLPETAHIVNAQNGVARKASRADIIAEKATNSSLKAVEGKGPAFNAINNMGEQIMVEKTTKGPQNTSGY